MLESLLNNQVFVGVGGATALGALMYLVRAAPGKVWGHARALFSINVETSNSDATHAWIVKWLAAQPYSATARRLNLTSGDGDTPPSLARRIAALASDEDDGKIVGARFMLSPGMGIHFFFYRNVPVLLTRAFEDGKSDQSLRKRETITLTLFTRNRDRLLQLIEEAFELSRERKTDRIRLFNYDFDSWHSDATVRRRNIDTVVLRAGIAEGVVADLQSFIDSQKVYEKRGVPWRRGYLLYGPPGTGKSSLVAALASHFEMDVAILNLANFLSNDAVVAAMRSQPEHTIMLIEDVDAAISRTGTGGTGDAKGITFSTVLNALDGLAAPEGRILVMTTNHVDKLDPALIRPGRIDQRIAIDVTDAEQAGRMFARFFDGDMTERAQASFGKAAAGLAPAAIQELLMSADSQFDAIHRAVIGSAMAGQGTSNPAHEGSIPSRVAIL